MIDELKSALHAEIRQALAKAGGDVGKINRTEVVKKYIEKGLPRSTAFKIASRALGIAPDGLPAVPAVTTAIGRPVYSAEALARDTGGFERVIGPSGTGLVQALEKCMEAAEAVMAHARHPDGRIRMSKSLVAGSEHLRRVIETAAKIHENMVTIQKIDAFYAALTIALQTEAPEVAAKVLASLRAVNDKWRGEVTQQNS